MKISIAIETNSLADLATALAPLAKSFRACLAEHGGHFLPAPGEHSGTAWRFETGDDAPPVFDPAAATSSATAAAALVPDEPGGDGDESASGESTSPESDGVSGDPRTMLEVEDDHPDNDGGGED